jgi:imidazolonepropionase
MKTADLIVRDAAQLITLDEPLPAESKGVDSAFLPVVPDGAVAVSDGKIIEYGATSDITAKYKARSVISAAGMVVTPGLVDPHTHLVFPATREDEFEMRNMGLSYKEITLKGGGIHTSVRKLRGMSREDLVERSLPHLNSALAHGTTTIEIKSGYGLTTKDEIKTLEAIAELGKRHVVDIVPTFLGAHEVPVEFRGDKEGYISLLINEMIPEVVRRGLAEFCDIFCEAHVYNIDESRRILLAAREAGMKLKMHADEIEPMGGAELAGELRAVSADHLVAASDAGIEALAAGGVVPVLLPATSFSLGSQKHAPARKMLDAGLPVALSTDFNPGTSFTESQQFTMSLACVNLKMSAAEALRGCTINAARAICRDEAVGSIAPGKQADMVVWNIPNYKHLGYHSGVNLVHSVIKKGNIVARNVNTVKGT